MENKLNFGSIILTVIITSIVVGSGVYYWTVQSSTNSTSSLPIESVKPKPTEEVSEQPMPTSDRPIILSPSNGSVTEGPIVTIKGKAKPNSDVWAYINYPVEDRACISSNSYANGGAGETDVNGNFEFVLAEPCNKNIEVFVSAVDKNAVGTGNCRGENNLSESVKFTLSGELPGVCNQ